MNNKQGIIIVLLAVLFFGLVVFFVARRVPVQNNINNVFKNNESLLQTQEPADLFVHSVGAGTFEQLDGDKYIVTLTGVDEDVIYFTDRPLHDTGKVRLARFLESLGFEIGNPPNAAIVLETENGEKTTVVVELTDPILNRDTGELIYSAVVPRDDRGEVVEVGAEELLPETFAKATFFIDGCGKKDEKFCGSTGKCYNPKKEKCGGPSEGSWKKHKEKECHGMKLGHAYDIASGHESECLVYDKAKLSEYDYRCDDSVKGWQIMMDVNIKGEPSKCDAYCIVVASEEQKTDEGVARVQYKCKDKKDEEEPKNKYCPKIDVSKGHDDENAVEHLIEKYHHILDKSKNNHTSYEHHYCVTTGMPYDTKKHWATDCSGLGGFALFETLPYHYKLIDNDRSAHTKADRYELFQKR